MHPTCHTSKITHRKHNNRRPDHVNGSALQPISVTPAPRSVAAPRLPAPRSAPAPSFSAMPAPPDFRPAPLTLRSRSAHMLCTRVSLRKQWKNQLNRLMKTIGQQIENWRRRLSRLKLTQSARRNITTQTEKQHEMKKVKMKTVKLV